ncbi:TFIP11 [Acanthosepion pharaonis]|uniref:TFIP11 n=1 Tax=Acanthosepion pharaonis TaxID=158019 RepID=A0A812CKQ4_ACAPH|nr:TFIP11 [Sepia pharaonis]
MASAVLSPPPLSCSFLLFFLYAKHQFYFIENLVISIMSSPEVEKFEVTDYDLENEFNPNRRQRRQTKNQATYGIWADPESDEEEKPMFGKTNTKKDYTLNFVSGGLKQAEKPASKTEGSDVDSEEEEPEIPVKKKKEPVALYGRFAGPERTQQSLKHFPVKDSDEEDEKDFREELQQWKREPSSATNRKPKYIYKTAQEVIESGGSRKKKSIQPSELSKVKVIDMTGKEKRVLSGYHAISQRHDKPDEDEDVIESTPKQRTAFDVPELIHNLNILVDMAEVEIIQNDRKHRHNSDQIINMRHEKERLDAICTQEEKQCNRLQEILDIVESCEKRTKPDCEDPLTLVECVTLFQKLQNDYYEEYKMYDMGALAIALVFPLVKKFYEEWEPLQDSSKGIKAMKEWRELLEDNNHHYMYNINNMDVYQRLIWDVWLPIIRKTIL